MPSSKRRKKQIAANRRQLEKARMKIQRRGVPSSKGCAIEAAEGCSLAVQRPGMTNSGAPEGTAAAEPNSSSRMMGLVGSLGGICTWCQTSISQVSSLHDTCT